MKNAMQNLYQKHYDRFNKKPIIIGVFWNNLDKIKNNIIKAIENGKPYNEYELLTKEEKKAFDDGNLLF